MLFFLGERLVRDLEDDVLAARPYPLNLHGNSLARLERGHCALELFDAADPAAIDLEKDVASFDVP